jgi:hypothetical protein
MQSTQAQQAAFYQNLMGEMQNHLGSLYQTLQLPAQPKVDRIESTFHLLSEKNRLMCTGKHNMALKTEILSDRGSRTAVTRFQKFFCSACAPISERVRSSITKFESFLAGLQKLPFQQLITPDKKATQSGKCAGKLDKGHP